MSTPGYRSDLSGSFPGLHPAVAESLANQLFAAVGIPVDAAQDAAGQLLQAKLLAQVNALHPRDLEESILVSQLLTNEHTIMACFATAALLDPGSREASRLRRDGIALQRVAFATLRVLHKSRTRPMLEDAETHELRPTVPVVQPRRAKAPAAPVMRAAAPIPADVPQQSETKSPENVAQSPVREAADTGSQQATPVSRQGRDPLADQPQLQRMRDQWSAQQQPAGQPAPATQGNASTEARSLPAAA